jgi:5-methylcytosine-specific restriction enzyme A
MCTSTACDFSVRRLEARNACIAHYGAVCQVCKFDFSSTYGQIGNGFIHVHHRVPIVSVGAEYKVRPLEDLVPVCPNCHAMLHRREPPLSVDELRAMLIDV